MNAIEKITENYNSLTKSERKVADYIVSNRDKVIHNTMSDLKLLLNVGDATIIRLCKKLGYSGFTELKISIAKNNVRVEEASFKDVSLLNKIKESLDRTYELIDDEKIRNVVKLIDEKRHIYLIGKGHSGLAAGDLERLMIRNGIQSTAIIDSDFQVNAATSMTADDLLIAFSLTGRTLDIIDVMEVARKKKATIVGITNYVLSPVAKLSDIVIQSSYDEFFSSPVPGRMSQLYISGLITEIYEKEQQVAKSLEIREQTLKAIFNRRLEE